jgi:hypothetical protein
LINSIPTGSSGSDPSALKIETTGTGPCAFILARSLLSRSGSNPGSITIQSAPAAGWGSPSERRRRSCGSAVRAPPRRGPFILMAHPIRQPAKLCERGHGLPCCAMPDQSKGGGAARAGRMPLQRFRFCS